MTTHEALSELIRRGTRNDETARHTIVLRLTGEAAEAAKKENTDGR